MTSRLLLLLAMAAAAFAADAPKRKILFFTKSSGFEHDVISYRGQNENKVVYRYEAHTQINSDDRMSRDSWPV